MCWFLCLKYISSSYYGFYIEKGAYFDFPQDFWQISWQHVFKNIFLKERIDENCVLCVMLCIEALLSSPSNAPLTILHQLFFSPRRSPNK